MIRNHGSRAFRMILIMCLMISLVLPSSAFAQDAGAAQVTGGGAGLLTVELLPDVDVLNGSLRINRVDAPIVQNTLDLQGTSTFNLNNNFIEPNVQYLVQLLMQYKDPVTQSRLFYYDNQELSGSELLTLGLWNLDADRKLIQPRSQAFSANSDARITYDIMVPHANDQSFKIPAASTNSLITSPRNMQVQLTESNNGIGYHVQKELPMKDISSVSESVYYDFQAEKNNAASLTLPPNVSEINITSTERHHQSMFNALNELKFTGGKQNIQVTTPVMADNQQKGMTWNFNGNVIPGEKLAFATDTTQLIIPFFNYNQTQKSFTIVPILQRGKFSFDSIYPLRSQFQVNIKHGLQDVNLQDIRFNIPNNIVGTPTESLVSGDYTAEVTFNMNGTLIQGKSNALRIQSNEIGGLPVSVQNEKGQPLQNGTVELYEMKKTDFFFDENLEKIFQNTIQDGISFIPHAYLLNGKQYQLLIQAKSEDGSPIIYHRIFTASNEGELTFTSKELRSLHINPNTQIAADKEQIGLILYDDQHAPLTISFSRDIQQTKQGIRQLYIATEAPSVDMQFNFYNSMQKTGYYDRRDQLRLSDSTLSVHPFTDLAEITLPPSLIGTISIDEGIDTESIYASKYYIQKGSKASIDYVVEKNGYRYFIYGYYDVNSNVQLPEKIKMQGNIYQHQWYENRVLIQYQNPSNNLNVSYIEDIHTNQMIFSSASQPEPTVNVNSVPGSEAVEYQLYDLQGNKLGSPVRSNLYQFQLNTNLTKGSEYRVRLEKQLFPADLLELSMDTTFIAEQTAGTLAEIPIQAPAGENFVNDDEMNKGEIGEIINTDKGPNYIYTSYASIKNNKLMVPNGIKPNSDYVVHLVMRLSSGDLYYKQLAIKGQELLQMRKIEASSQLTTYSQTADAPFSSLVYSISIPNVSYKFSIMNRSKLVTDAKDILAQSIYHSERAIYHLTKPIHSNGSKKVEFSFENEQKAAVPITIQTEKSSTSIDAFFDMSTGLISDMPYNTLYTNPGERRYGFITKESRPYETPWSYTWEQPSPIDIQQETELKLSNDIVQKSLEYFNIHKDEKNQYSVSSLVHLTSRDFTLTSLGVYREYFNSFSARSLDGPAVSVIKPYDGQFDRVNQVFPIITVKDRSGKVIVEQENNEYLDYFNITLPSDIKPGNYTLTYQLPTGPRESIELSKTFEIRDPNTNPGGGDNGGSTGPSPGTGGGNNGGGNPGGGGGGGGAPALPGGAVPAKPDANQENKDIVDIASANVPQAVNGKVEINVSSKDTTQIQLPSSITSTVGSNTLVIRTPNGDVEIPSSVLKELAGLVNMADTKDVKVKVTLKPVTQEAAAALLKPWQSQMTQAGQIVELGLSITSNGRELPLKQFSTPIKVILNVTDASDREIIGIYGMDGSNGPTYVGGKLNGDKLVAELTHSGKYGVLKFNKTFSDVPASHWAYQAIRELTAKQIAKGFTADQFAPSREITRAEFVQFLVNALHLTASTTPTFKDVPAASWYADAVAAGVEHGIVRGLSAEQFGPNQAITREEMAVIVTQAYRNMTKQELQAAAAASFSDRSQASSWAQSAIDQAVAIQLLQGTNAQTFAPKQHATRAEAAKVILNLLAKK
ncbi:S-layer homology domain-containing protein [Paenibacillus guangzhouensis]|uniref:S-layer homology domain-containing protein n=1 Tax=Paenibacillus guangzhouensis TaxID=1473112 RepID=UPI001266AEA8|nr:S-layer homology domain-containing protein [Paenibacillus guangzhouensis]